ncbi:hypothetical protein CRYUN_Cryun06bG0001800 [Craigia yunnanensis]
MPKFGNKRPDRTVAKLRATAQRSVSGVSKTLITSFLHEREVGDNHQGYSGGLRPTGNQKGAVDQTGNFDGYHGETNGNLQISPNGIYENGCWRSAKQSSKGFHQNDGGMHWESTRNELQNKSDYGSGNYRGYGDNAQNNANMQNQGGSYWEGPTEMRQNQNYLNLQRFPESQGSLNENYVHNNWQFQQSKSDQHVPNFSQYQQNPQDIIYNANSYGQVSATSNREGESTEVSETSSNNATTEMLNKFFN